MAPCPICECPVSETQQGVRSIPLVPIVPDIVVDVTMTWERCVRCQNLFFTPEQSTAADAAIAEARKHIR